MASFDNKVIGNKLGDNKQDGNRRTAESATQMGKVGKSAGDTKLNVQNSREQKAPGVDQSGNDGEKKNAKRAKSLRTQNMFSDGAISRAQWLRGKE